jgi:hypothetical protein
MFQVFLSLLFLKEKLGLKYVIAGVPAPSTSFSIKKSLDTVGSISRYIIENHNYSSLSIRTGRVIFWTPDQLKSSHVILNDKKLKIIKMDKKEN